MGLVSKMFDNIGQKIGEGYAKQGKSWDEVVNMPSSGSGLGKALINSSAKTGYDNYMAKNNPAPVSTSSANMLQTPSVSGGGLAESGSNTYTQPTLMSGITNPVADSSVFGNRTNGSGMVNGYITQGYNGGLAAMANGSIKAPGQYDVVGGAKLI